METANRRIVGTVLPVGKRVCWGTEGEERKGAVAGSAGTLSM